MMYMEKTLISSCCLRRFVLREFVDKIISNKHGIDHFSFGIAGMNTFSLENNFGTSCIEIFIFQFTYLTTVHGVSPFGSKFFYVKMMGTTTYFFIGSKCNSDFSVFDFRIVNQEFHCSH